MAHADWLITPFLGTSFASQTTFLIFEEGAGPKLTLGASVSLLGDGVFGLKAEVAHTPRFFEGNDPLGLVLTSRVTTVSGSAVVAAPLAMTRESLRPYLVGGIGLIQARSKHAADLFPVDENLPAVHIGALLHESSLARTMPTDRILTCRCDTTLVGRGRSSD